MIGIFDSGVGGLSVWRELYKLMPEQDYIYVSDSAHCPYGRKSADEIIDRAKKITDFLIAKHCDIIVVACNTATAAAIKYLRTNFEIPFVGMEPAIKPAALKSKSGVVGVLATAGTFKGSLYLQTLTDFAANIEVIEQIGDGLVELVEEGKTSGAQVDKLLYKYITPMLQANADHIVLGCTHYPFLANAIKELVGSKLIIVNPAPAVALHTQHLLQQENSSLAKNAGESYFFSTGKVETMQTLVKQTLANISAHNFSMINI